MRARSTGARIGARLIRLARECGIRPATVVKLALAPVVFWCLYRLWFAGGVGVATWELMRAMYTDPRAFTAGVFALAGGVTVMRLLLRMIFKRPSLLVVGEVGPANTARAVAAAHPSSDPIPADVRRGTATHEAAHLVASVERDVEVTEVMVRRHYPAGRRGLMGSVSNPPLTLSRPDSATPEQWFDRMVVLLAGRADDTRRGRSVFGSVYDCDQAHEIAAMLYRYRAIHGAESAEAIFDGAMDQAQAIVAGSAALIEELAGLLLDATSQNETVSAEDLNRIVSVAINKGVTAQAQR